MKFEHWVSLLTEGISQKQIEERLTQELKDNPSISEVKIARMNLIGSLRGEGYKISNRSNIYKIEGFESKSEYIPADQWTGKEREILDWIYSLPIVCLDHREGIDSIFHRVGTDFFYEQCFAYLWCYEGGVHRLSIYSSDDGDAIILLKNRQMPRLEIFNLNLDTSSIYRLAQQLAPGSLTPIKTVYCNYLEMSEFQKYSHWGIPHRYRQGVYDLKRIISDPLSYFGERPFRRIRSLEKQILWDRFPADPLTEKREYLVIKAWKDFNEKKHRQLAINRDYRVRDLDTENDYHFLGLNQGVPCCLQVLTRCPNTVEWAIYLVEKALNYKSIEGGHPGLSDFGLYKLAEYLLAQGIKFVNTGLATGGEPGLKDRKERLTSRAQDRVVYTFDFAINHLNREKWRRHD